MIKAMRNQSETIKSNDPKRIEKLKKKIEDLDNEYKFLKHEKRKNMIKQGVLKFDIDYQIKSVRDKIRKMKYSLNKAKKPKRAVIKESKKERDIERAYESLFQHWLYD
jgi:uncharacterized protein YpuA (DUF1002 family)